MILFPVFFFQPLNWFVSRYCSFSALSGNCSVSHTLLGEAYFVVHSICALLHRGWNEVNLFGYFQGQTMKLVSRNTKILKESHLCLDLDLRFEPLGFEAPVFLGWWCCSDRLTLQHNIVTMNNYPSYRNNDRDFVKKKKKKFKDQI